jgi:hypothetical protein
MKTATTQFDAFVFWLLHEHMPVGTLAKLVHDAQSGLVSDAESLRGIDKATFDQAMRLSTQIRCLIDKPGHP